MIPAPPKVNAGALAHVLNEEVSRLGVWPVLERLLAARDARPEDLRLRGYVEILRNCVVREMTAGSAGMEAAPKLTNEFLSDYGRFNLSAQEGYLVSLIDGRLTMQKLLRLSPFDPFTTLFYLAKLQRQKAISVPV